MHEEIQSWKAHQPIVIYLHSGYFTSCLCEKTNPRLGTSTLPLIGSHVSQSLIELEQMGILNLKIVEFERQLVEKKDKLKQAHEKNVEYLLLVNQLLHEKFGERGQYEQFQVQNASLKQKLGGL